MAVLTQTIPQISVEGFPMDDYVVVDIVLHKELLQPSRLEFNFRRKSLLRKKEDVRFDMASRLLGSKVKLEIQTMRRDKVMESKSETLAFTGIIFGIENTRAAVGNAAYYHATAYSPDYLLVDNPHCASFEDKSLTEIITESISDYRNTLRAELNPGLTARFPYTVQYNETTYQFISRLAQRFGQYLYFDNDRLYFGETPSGEERILHPDIDVLGFSYSLNMEHTELSHAQHDYIKYENTVQNGYDNSRDAIHDLTDTVFDHSHSTYRKQTLQNLHSSSQEYSSFMQNQVSTTVEGWGQKSRMMTCTLRTNRADICIGDRITIQEYTDEGELKLIDHHGLMAVAVDYHATIGGHFENTVKAIPADAPYPPYGMIDLYPICESQRAIVIDNNDPESLGRIRVQFLWQELQAGNNITPWLRITQPHGGDDKGFYFIPEIGEEVMVAFENGNGEKPYVVGTLYHGKQRPGNSWPGSSNDIKAIRTRNGHTVEIHDVAQGGFIRIYDYKKENYILTYSTDEKLIKLESTGNIELYAKNDIIMHAGHDINASADNDIFIAAGNDMQRTAENDIREYAGNNRNTNIDVNDSLNVGENQFIQIGDNKDEQVAHKVQLTAENIREEATNQLLEYSKTHHMKADNEMALNAGSKIDIKAGIVKVN